jgi:nucleotide-binding universal stress UspA family protein
MPHNKVLIPLDGSAFSERILPVVRHYLRPEENELLLFLAVETPDGGTGGVSDLVADGTLHNQTLFRLSARQLDQALHPIYASQIQQSIAFSQEDKLIPIANELRAAGYIVTTEVSFGDPAQAIKRYVEHHEIDLVAMTTHWRKGLQRVLTGSVADYILRHIAVPMLLLHPPEEGNSG